VTGSRHTAAVSRPPRVPGEVGPGWVEAISWTGLYLILSALPLLAALVRPLPEARGFWIEFAVALGFVALAMLALQFALTARFRRVAAPFGLDTLLQFHRQAGLLAFGLALAHPLILILAHRPYLEFLDLRVSLVRALALWVLLLALVLLVVMTLWRRPLGLAYEWWRATHGLLALAVVFIGLTHVLRVGHYVSAPWQQALWIGFTAAAMLLILHVRVVKPFKLRNRPYRIAEVRPERGAAWTLSLTPLGHPGATFDAGQFAWLTIGPTPFSMQQHPFSFASSAARTDRVEFTVKELGDFTGTIGEVRPGSTAFLEGPYGSFTLHPLASGAAFIVGGVGITPVMSILRTLRHRGDRRPLVLVYGNREWEDVIFREELEEVARELNLRLVHLLENPHPGWAGESGRLDDELLRRHLAGARPREWQFFVCGPEPMMDLAERFLLENGVPLRRLNSERFNIA
jgi:predicted ferric reductase